MNIRIKELRKFLNLSQDDFGKRIGLSKSGISSIESLQRNVTEKHIKLVCSEFDVSEDWLRYGTGNMFKKTFELDKTASYVSDLLEDDDNPLYTLIKEIMHTYIELDKKSQDVLKDSCLKLINNLQKEKED